MGRFVRVRAACVPAAAAAALAAGLSGCGGGGGEAVDAAPSSTSYTVGSRAAGAALEAAVEAARTAATGTFDARVTRAAPTVYDQHEVTTYDLANKRWSTTISQQETAAGGEQKSLERTMAGTGSEYYVSAPAAVGPGAAAQWIRGKDKLSVEGISLLATLAKIVPTSMQTSPDGSVVSGLLPGVNAAALLGFTDELAKGEIVPTDISQGARVNVALDKAGHLAALEIAGKELTILGAGVEDGLRAEVKATSYKAEFSRLGEPVTIELPDPATVRAAPKA